MQERVKYQRQKTYVLGHHCLCQWQRKTPRMQVHHCKFTCNAIKPNRNANIRIAFWAIVCEIVPIHKTSEIYIGRQFLRFKGVLGLNPNCIFLTKVYDSFPIKRFETECIASYSEGSLKSVRNCKCRNKCRKDGAVNALKAEGDWRISSVASVSQDSYMLQGRADDRARTRGKSLQGREES